MAWTDSACFLTLHSSRPRVSCGSRVCIWLAGGTVEVVWSDWDPTFIYTNEGELSLVNPINQVVDYVQWGSPDHAAELNAAANNIWVKQRLYCRRASICIYTGTGGFGVSEWSFVPYECNVIEASAGVTSECDLNSGYLHAGNTLDAFGSP